MYFKLNHTHHTKINIKWTLDLNKILGKKPRRQPLGPRDRLRVLRHDTKIVIHKRKIDKLDFTEVKNLCSAKDPMKRMKKQATDWEKIHANCTPDKGLVPKLYK